MFDPEFDKEDNKKLMRQVRKILKEDLGENGDVSDSQLDAISLRIVREIYTNKIRYELSLIEDVPEAIKDLDEEELKRYQHNLKNMVKERTEKLTQLNDQLRQEIERRKQTEWKLRKLEKAIETTEVGVTITDEKRRIIYTNPADAQMHGYAVEELIGKSSNIFSPPELQEDTSIINLKEYPNWKRERINLRKDGTTFPVMLISNFIKDENDKPIGVVTICEDITDRKQAELTLRESEQTLRELNATKDKFFSIIAHDLKNPFHGIIVLTEMLTQYWHKLTDEDIRKRIQVIHKTAFNSFKLLENLLQWARSQTGSITINPTLVDLKVLVDETVSFLHNNAESKNIKLHSDIENSMLVKTDSNMIITVLRNLVANAIKFTPQNGSVFITARKVANDVEVVVADTGIGIEEKRLKKIFRIDALSKTTRGTKGECGTGLGLILCKEFVENNGGKIWVESELGKGTTFKFTLPTF